MSGTPPAPNPTPPNREDSQVRPGSSSTGSEKSPGGGSKPRNLGDVLREFAGHQQTMRAELAKVIVGQEDTIGQLLAAIFTRGHCLLEGVPGLAKTLMVSTLANILDVGFKRIQFTPDLMPSDITGTQVLEEDDQGRRSFRFVEAPFLPTSCWPTKSTGLPPRRRRHCCR